MVEIHRAQGELDVLERILGLQEELLTEGRRLMQKKVADNERQRVESQGG